MSPRILRSALALAVALALGCGEPVPGPFITDAQGRALILHGANVSGSAKNHPQRLPWVTQSSVQRMADDFGFNFARYLIFWDAVEPQPGVIDSPYLDAVQTRLDWFAASGIHVVLDMHQDVYAKRFCCDGAPNWAIDDDGLPFTPNATWWLNYLKPAVMAAFDNFFDVNGKGTALMDHYGDAWAAVATRFRDHPAVIGYDLMNEPSPGSYLDLVAGPDGGMAIFDREYLTPFYQRTIGRIRAVDPDGWIFLEPLFLLPAAGEPSYVEPLTDPRPGEPRLAWFPHLYSAKVELNASYDPTRDATIPNWEVSRGTERERLGMPVLIGEFGVTDAVVGGADHLRDVLDMADRATTGWTYWEYNSDAFGFLRADGTEKPKAAALVRTYPRAVAGRPLHVRYDSATHVFALVFAETGVPGPTEIYVPEGRWYPNGFDVRASDPAGAWSTAWDADREILSVWTDPEQTAHVVTITPRPVP
jgi:endoglycosylceramidase